MTHQIDFAPISDAELDWIMKVESDAREEGFVRGNDRAMHRQRMRNPQTNYLSIRLSGGKVGFVILEGINTEDRNVELARIIVVRRGEGIGQAAIRELIRHTFQNLGAHRMWPDVLPNNIRAQHVYRKLGFKQEGRIREALFLDGQHHDMLLLELLARDWCETARYADN